MKPKLLIIHNRLVVGGPALDTIPLAHHLQQDFDIRILYGCKENDETEPSFLLEKYKGLALVNIPSLQRSPNFFKDITAYRHIYKYIKTFQPDIVHTHGAKVGFFGRMAAKRAGVPLIVHTFHGHLFHSYFNKFFTSLLILLERRLVKITDIIIAISESQKKELESILKIDKPSKIKLVPLGVDYIDVIMAEHYRQAFKRTYMIQSDTICVGIMGRMVGIKNPVFFLRVAENILKKHKGRAIKFFLIGDGNEMSAMKQFLEQHKIPYSKGLAESPVVFTSWVQNIQSVLEGLDIVALTSFNEGTPMSLIEAQLCGKPVVAVNVGGVRDTMIDGETGFLINGHHIDEFSAAIIRLAEDDILRTTMGKNAKQFATRVFSKEKEIENMKNLYLSYETV